jgi:ankyrin repeat protein
MLWIALAAIAMAVGLASCAGRAGPAKPFFRPAMGPVNGRATPMFAALGVDHQDRTGIEYHTVAEGESLKSVRALLDRGGDPNERTLAGYTPLMVAVMEGFTAVVRLLIARGADVNAVDFAGSSALFLLAQSPAPDAGIVDLLADAGARVDAACGRDSGTALMEAAQWDHAVVVARLLAHGAGPERRRADGETAVSIARKRGDAEIAHLLDSASHSRGSRGHP